MKIKFSVVFVLLILDDVNSVISRSVSDIKRNHNQEFAAIISINIFNIAWTILNPKMKNSWKSEDLSDSNGPICAPTKQTGSSTEKSHQQNNQASSTSQSTSQPSQGTSSAPGSGSTPPPPPPPNNQQSIPADQIVLIEDEDEDEDIEILEDMENAVTLEDCQQQQQQQQQQQPSTAAIGHSRQSSGGSSSVRAVSVGISTSSEASIGPSPLQIAVPITRNNPGQIARPMIIRSPLPDHLQWPSLMWGTQGSGVTNTCNIDSFLSHVIYLSRAHFGYFHRHLNLVNSIHENAIIRIIEQSMDNNNIIRSFQFSRFVHFQWFNAVSNVLLPASHQLQLPRLPNSNAVNFSGSELEHIAHPLRDSSMIWYIHTCQCDRPSAETTDRTYLWSGQDLHNLNNNAFNTRTTTKKCKTCKSKFNSNRCPAISPATWFQLFRLRRDMHYTEVPESLTFLDIGSGSPVQFDLGYISIHANEHHQTSIHRIGNTYRYYDGMQHQGQLQDIPENLGTMKVNSAVYFRRNGSI